jgi:hypothetical protein
MRKGLTYWFLGSVLLLVGLAALVSGNRSISFYAKCIDQFGKPAAGLKVEITILGNGSSITNLIGGVAASRQSKETIPVTVGADGMIVVEGKRGSSVQVGVPYMEEFLPGRGEGSEG